MYYLLLATEVAGVGSLPIALFVVCISLLGFGWAGLVFLRLNLSFTAVLTLVRSLFQLFVLAVVLAIAVAFPGWGTIGVSVALWFIMTQFTHTRLEFALDRGVVAGILLLAAGTTTVYSVFVGFSDQGLSLPQAWIPLWSLSLGSASAAIVQVGNGIWHDYQHRHQQQAVQDLDQDLEDLADLEDWEEEQHILTTAPVQSPQSSARAIDILRQILQTRFQQWRSIALVGLPLVFAAQILVGVDPLMAATYEWFLMLFSFSNLLIGAWGIIRATRQGFTNR